MLLIFALPREGSPQALPPTDFSINVIYDSVFCVGPDFYPNPFDFGVTVRNISPWTFRDVYFLLELHTACAYVDSGDNPRYIGNMYPGVQRGANWRIYSERVCAGETIEYTIQVGGVSSIINNRILLLDSPDGYTHLALDIVDYDYTIVTPAAFYGVDLNDYGILFVGWHMSNETHNALLARAADIEDWWRDGGRILVSGQLRTGRFDWVPLPVTDIGLDYDVNRVLDASHIIITGADGIGGGNDLNDDRISHWNISCHTYFTSWHPAYNVLTVMPLAPSYASILALDKDCDDEEGRIILSGQDFDYHTAFPTQPEPGATWADTFLIRCLDYLNYKDCGAQFEGELVMPLCECSGPVPRLIRPTPEGVFVACDRQIISIVLASDVWIDTLSIRLRVNGINYRYPANMWFDPDTLFFQPATPFGHGDTVTFTLLQADDIDGCEMVHGISSGFVMDLLPPHIFNTYPPGGSLILDSTQSISFDLSDDPSGVDPATIVVQINEGIYTTSDAGVFYSDGHWHFHPDSAGILLPDGDTTRVCVLHAADNVAAVYCGPNDIREALCWQFYVDYRGPVITRLAPEPYIYSACRNEQIRLLIQDPSPLDTTSINLQVNGVNFNLSMSSLSLHGDTLVFDPGPALWAALDTVIVIMLEVSDIYGNTSAAGLSWSFYIDFDPPVIWNCEPEGLVTTSFPEFSFNIADSGCGLGSYQTVLTINSTNFYIYSPGVTWAAPHFTLNTEILAREFFDGESVSVCIHGEDVPDECAPNRIDTCWSIYVTLQGPEARALFPEPGLVSGCPYQHLVFFIHDTDGIMDSTIRLEVNGDIFRVSDPELLWRGDSLIFTPSSPWNSGDTVRAMLLSANDLYGNPLMDHPYIEVLIDLDPPVIVNNPLENSVIADSLPRISLTLTDSIAGISDSIEYFLINGVEVPAESLSLSRDYSELTITYYISASRPLSHNDTVTICLGIYDLPDLCEPNLGEYCYRFYVDLLGPYAELLFPDVGAISACSNQALRISIADNPVSHGIDSESIILNIDDYGSFSILSPFLHWDSGTLLFQPAAGFFRDADTVIYYLYAYDSLGNALDDYYSWDLIIDLSPPVMINNWPGTGEVITSISPLLSFELIDDISGVMAESALLSINHSEYDLGESFFNRTDSGYYFDCDLAGLEFSGGDTILVCVQAFDQPQLCDPNALDTCWQFYIARGGPIVTSHFPATGIYSACNDQGFYLVLEDPEGVESRTIELQVNAGLFHITDAELTFIGDTLFFSPSLTWTDGETLHIRLLEAEDVLGNPLEAAPYSWSFYIDLSPPFMSALSPGAGDTLTTVCPVIEFQIADSFSGLAEWSIILNADTFSFSTGSPAVFWDGMNYSFDLCRSGIILRGGDSLRLCLHAADDPDLCEPHNLDTCWQVFVQSGGPEAELLEPFNMAFSACDTQTIQIQLTDPNGLEDSTILLEVAGSPYSVSDEFLSYYEPLLVFRPEAGTWSDGDTIMVNLSSAEDILGNHLEAPLLFTFIMDFSPPVSWCEDPSSGSIIAELTPTVSCSLTDHLSGIDTTSITFLINRIEYRIDHPGNPISCNRNYAQFHPESVALSFSGGDTVEVCLSALDQPDYCGGNGLFTCWDFYISAGGPLASIIEPLGNSYSACAHQEIIMALFDPNGIDPGSILLQVNDIFYTVTDSVLVFEDTLLRYFPAAPFADGDTIRVILVEAADRLGNSLEASPDWEFYIDLSPPVMWGEDPANGTFADSISPEITVVLADSMSGLNPDSLVIWVDSILYLIGESGIYWNGEQLRINTTEAGLYWERGDRIEVCLRVQDRPHYCPPNQLDSCWYFFITAHAPLFELLFPLENTTSNCFDQRVGFILYSEHGIEPGSVHLQFGDTLLAGEEAAFSYPGDTVYFAPGNGFWQSSDTIRATLWSLEDTLGNTAEDTPFEWTFYFDLEAPYAENFYPPEGDTVYYSQNVITVDLQDNLLGIDPGTVLISLEGFLAVDSALSFDLYSPAISWDGITLGFDPRFVDETALGVFYTPPFDSLTGTGLHYRDCDSISVCIEAMENHPDYCEPLVLSPPNCWSFYFIDTMSVQPNDTLGPEGVMVFPTPGTITSCNDQEIRIVIYDENRLDISSIVLNVDGAYYDLTDSMLTLTQGSLLVFAPCTDYFRESGRVEVTLAEARDLAGNGLAQPLSWHFYLDFQPPEAELAFPVHQGIVEGPPKEFKFFLYDSLSGLDSSLILIILNGDSFELDHPGVFWRPTNLYQGELELSADEAGLTFLQEDTIRIVICSGDRALYCGANRSTFYCEFVVKGIYSCGIHPNPFTPNGDNYNDYVIFDYPGMFFERGNLQIYDLRGIKVREKVVGPISSIKDYNLRFWDGTDAQGNLLPEGIYIYHLEIGGKTLCNGTVVLVR